MSEILTAESLHWDLFCIKLEAALTEGMPENIWNCDDTFRLASSVLAELGDIDIAATLNYFVQHGGTCDCQILTHVDPWGGDDGDGGGDPVPSSHAA